MTQELLKRLDTLAATLGTTTQYMWGILVKQAHVNAYRDLGFAIMLLAFTIICALVVKSGKADFSDNNADDELAIAKVIAGSVVGCIVFFFAVSNAYTCLGEFLNPEYYALQSVLEALK